MRWQESDKKRVRVILDHITAEGSQAEFSRELKTKSRATVNNWRRRGQVPLEHIPAVIEAAKPGMIVTAGQLHPLARVLDQRTPATKKAKKA